MSSKKKRTASLDANHSLKQKRSTGPSGTGKTSSKSENDVPQLIHRSDGSVVVFDCKGDVDYFKLIVLAGQLADHRFKEFTNKPSHSINIFNPWNILRGNSHVIP